MAWPAAAELAVMALVCVAAGLGWATVFGMGPVAVPVTVAVVVAVGTTAALAWFTRWTLATRLLAVLGLLVVVAAAVALRRPPVPGALGEVAAGLRNGWRQILSSAPLAEPTGGPMVTAVAATWLAAWGAAELVLRTRRVLLPLIPPLAGFSAALALGAGGIPLPRWVPALLTIGAGGWLLVRSAGLERFGLRRWAAAAAAVAVAALAAVALGPRLPGAEARPRFDPRVLVEDPVVVRDQTNPLATLTAQVTGDASEVFTVRTDRPVGTNWRLTVLDRFEGNQWVSTSTFHRIGGTIAGDETSPGNAARVRQRVTVAGLDGWFLPAATRPVEVTVPGLATDDDGVLVVPADRRRPASYTVVSAVPSVDPAEVAAAVPVSASGDSGAGAMPEPPEVIRRTALEVTRDQRTAYGKLVALRNHFRDPASGFVYDNGEDAPTGNSFNAIETLLETRQGTAEQFASAFAVMAADLGYRTRVVVGYLPGSYDDATGTYTVTTHEAHAWPEVGFEGLGWVAFEPSPLDRQTVQDPEDEDATTAPATTVPDPVPSDTQPEPGPPTTLPVADGSGGGGGPAGPVGTGAFVSLAVVIAAAAAVAGIVGAKAARRGRRRQGGAAQRIAGAWREALDRLVESGVEVPASSTATDVAGAAGSSGVAPAVAAPLGRLAGIANRARFDGRSPGDDDAGAAWSAQDEMAAALRTGRSRIGRLRAAVDPRPLLRHHR
jgi:transglutaminase-like putative cysteine protease